MPRLSILICHLNARVQPVQRLLQRLARQHEKWKDALEILVESDDGQMPIGAKRNKLIQQAKGDFTAFVDDDDLVAEHYVDDIFHAIDSKPEVDVIGICGTITFGRGARRDPRTFIHSITCNGWYEKDRVYYRTPNHLNPIARRHTSVTPFPAISFGEDKAWSDAIRPLLKTEVLVSRPIYFYEAA